MLSRIVAGDDAERDAPRVSLTLSLYPSLSRSVSLSLLHTLSLFHPLTPSHSHTLSLTLTLSLSQPFTLSHSLCPTLTVAGDNAERDAPRAVRGRRSRDQRPRIPAGPTRLLISSGNGNYHTAHYDFS